ncbi:MAG: FAD-dependent oxidoreductase [Tenericutes bacterium]|jgi:thioredoxin reductase (NADPH)|nr:FAD-dependent oxidoreductase [Mycoplasmatota bacterium]
MLYDLLIIGAGPAGITAAIYAQRANLKVAMFEKGAPGGQLVNTNEIENYTGSKKMAGYELATLMIDHAYDIGVEVIYEEITKVELDGNVKKVFTDNQTYETKAIIVASGTVPRRLGVENEDQFAMNGISWCAICDGPLYKGKKVLVVGGGNSAVEEASYLASFTTHVTVVQNLEDLTADKKSQDILRKFKNVDFRYSSLVKKFLGDEKGLTGVIITDEKGREETILVDGVFEYVGLIPVTGMVKDLGITNEYGYIVANEKMETKVPGVYAAGDVIVKQIRQVVTATGDGAVAAQNALKYIESWE